MVVNTKDGPIQCDAFGPGERRAIERGRLARDEDRRDRNNEFERTRTLDRGRRGARDGDDLVSELRRRLSQNEWEKIADLFDGGADEGTGGPERPRDRVAGWTEKQMNVGFTGAGDRSPGRRGRSTLAQMFPGLKPPPRV
jgi:hypothetical protein